MKLSINLDYVMHRRQGGDRPLEDALKLCRDAGIRHLDYLTPINGEDFEDQAYRAKNILDSLGMVVHQTHCPFFRYQENGPEIFAVQSLRAAKASAILGAKHMVVHADEWPPKGEPYSIHKALKYNYELIAPVVDECLRLGVHPAFENLFDENARPKDTGRDRYCANAEELLTLIGKFNDDRLGICLDTGHAHVGHKEHFLGFVNAIADYVTCTHVHDNKNHEDSHLPAFLGTIPFEEVFAILKKHNYQGTLSWEMVYGRLPDELMPVLLNYLAKCGEYLGCERPFA